MTGTTTPDMREVALEARRTAVAVKAAKHRVRELKSQLKQARKIHKAAKKAFKAARDALDAGFADRAKAKKVVPAAKPRAKRPKSARIRAAPPQVPETEVSLPEAATPAEMSTESAPANPS